MRETVKVYYNTKQVCTEQISKESYSKSPLKPALYVDAVKTQLRAQSDLFEWVDDFRAFRRTDFYNAHEPNYVNQFFDGKGRHESNGLPWSKKLSQSVRYTNSSLYNAIKESIHAPNHMYISPTSGFHHAQPQGGMGFCTFSGQVIASMKLYRKLKLRGAYLDLDGHYGNSIGDSWKFIKENYNTDLNDVIPMNINPKGSGDDYLDDLSLELMKLEWKLINDEVDYIVWCHGADSHKDDDLGGQLTTEQWVTASEMFYGWLNDVEQRLGKKIPLTLSLFGGYRSDDYQSVINLHLMDLIVGMNSLMNQSIELDTLFVAPKEKRYQNYV